MSKKIAAIQMNQVSSINPAGDSTYLIAMELQKRGYLLFCYQGKDLCFSNLSLSANGYFVEFFRSKENYYKLLKQSFIDLESVDLILLREDPPFDICYLTYTYLLDKLADKVPIFNHPTGVRNCNEKITALQWPQYCLPTLISNDRKQMRSFAQEHGTIVVKPLYNGGGMGVKKLGIDDFDKNISHILPENEHLMLQPFLADIFFGDKRILILEGKVLGAMIRVPKKGDFRANLVLGGSIKACELTKVEMQICDDIAPFLIKHGLWFVGIDIIQDYLIEVNVTSPTGLAALNELYGFVSEEKVVNFIERKLCR